MVRKAYSAPALTRVELRADEAVLAGCKVWASAELGAPGLPGDTLGCRPPDYQPACREPGS